MRKRAFRIAYDGTGYYGFQRQPDVPTVEGAIFDALVTLEVLSPDANKPAGYAAAGRTDAGVSALAQTVAFEAPDWLTPRALNGELPADVRAWAASDAPSDFHATHDAVRREYTYHLYAPRDSSLPSDEGEDAFDDDRFHAACDALSGHHDVHNLTPDDHNTERAPTLEAARDGPYFVVTVSAGGFARELVRRLVSLARSIAVGEAPLEKVDRVFAPEALPGHEGVAPAPPEPLVLTDVEYPDLVFERDDRAASSAREIFEARRIDRRTAGRVAGQLADGVGGL
ncbi:tRNA pseudouridine(38-40) synthase TruA [Natronorubrum daqingense]|uniref:tRNA pseudouridine synthase A n=1 Tax=Natronorubrum daqingense TaxID=588898 RepID=A0A1N7ABA7_9EURY|nr:tRNA pseudouridine(38-40) synthase TruA [Natronorubrum daqingense]APX98048.1 tRNA pseudouridine(38-40) synthase TruA [Natronorubrum daqingense]SIR36291.1 tRNA pseudouridine38-40 synthase [Natronorubrum daqingense]